MIRRGQNFAHKSDVTCPVAFCLLLLLECVRVLRSQSYVFTLRMEQQKYT